ncbi:MAG TPA: hypothetical protein VJ600_00935 [Holophagaceae bacterium]|nr:hypothetical protein [Holophagaceae bacterium]
MNHARHALLSSALALAALAGCSRDRATKTAAIQPAAPPPAAAATTAGPMASGTVVETMDAAEYTYVRVKTATGEIWAAAGKFPVKVGDKVVVPVEMPMENFHSNTLNRTFKTIYFTSRIFHEGDPDLPKAR